MAKIQRKEQRKGQKGKGQQGAVDEDMELLQVRYERWIQCG